MAFYSFPEWEFGAVAMHQNTMQHSEEIIFIYKLFIPIDGTRQTVEIHEIAMDGWRLFECFIPGADTVVYLSRDEGETEIKCVDMGDEEDAQYAALLIEALKPFTHPGHS